METVYEMRILLIIGVPLWIIVRSTILFLKKRNGFKINLYKEILTNVFVLYLFMLIGITIFPIRIGDAINYLPDMSIYEKYNINLIPFIDYLKNKVSFKVLIKNIGGNLLLLSPFILYLCIRFKIVRNLKVCLLISFLISLSIELTQLIMNVLSLTYLRAVHIEDLILNTLGGVITYYIFNKYINSSSATKYSSQF